MLRRLTIRDFVLVDQLELAFDGGFGVLTGETGAGKSILVDALAFLLGERADTGLIRAGRERAEVVAEFDVTAVDGVGRALAEQEIAGDDGALLLRRVVETGGRSRAWLNGTPVTLAQLRTVTDQLVDIHGQHAHQSLLRADAQRELVDEFGGLAGQASAVREAYQRWREAEAALRDSQADREALQRQRDSLQWEVDELRRLALGAGEWELLNTEQGRLANAAALLEGSAFCLQALAESEQSCDALLAGVAGRLDELARYDPALSGLRELIASAQAELAEAAAALRRYGERVDLDPGRLAEVDRRIDAILGVARKFRVQPGELGALLAEREARLATLSAAGDQAALAVRAETAAARYQELAAALSKARTRAARALSEAVSERLHGLALGGGRFEVALVPLDEGNGSGLERVEFRVGGLAGADLRPLAKVASGGELSRISLALQVVASQAARVPTLIFDEVDVGIGGGVAEVVGRLLRALGQTRQVLCVTHLPQVAACADRQWRVSKVRHGDGYRSDVELLDQAGREEEVARMLGGVKITQTTREHARELLAATAGIG